jgi:heat shock protein HtpX
MRRGLIGRAWAGVLAPIVALSVLLLLGLNQAGHSAVAVVGVFVGTVVLLLSVLWALRCDLVVLDAVSAEPASKTGSPVLFVTVTATAERLRVPVPHIAICRTATPFAFAVGRSRTTTTLCVSEGLLLSLDDDGLLAVVAHELAHAAGPLLLPRSVASAWSTALLSITDRIAILSVLNPLGLWVRRLGVTAAQQTDADLRTARSLAEPLALSTALRALDAGTSSAPLSPTGRLVAVSALMTISPFGNDVRAARLAGQPDTAARLLRLEALAGYRR